MLSERTSICSAARVVWCHARSGFLRLRLQMLLLVGQGGVPLSGCSDAELLLDCLKAVQNGTLPGGQSTCGLSIGLSCTPLLCASEPAV